MILLVLLGHFACCWAIPLRILSFNTWNNGRNVNDGPAKIAAHILALNPDIVAMQEVETAAEFQHVLTLLGDGWSGVFRQNVSYPDSGIITRHRFKGELVQINSDNEGNAIGTKIVHDSGHLISFWCVHLDWNNYGPYAACNKQVSSMWQIMAGEYNVADPHPSRAQNALQILSLPRFVQDMAKADKIPMFLAGDFNCPSHLDWTVDNAANHCGWSVPWPATKMFVDEAGFIDSYREVHTSPIDRPGSTWSAVQKAEAGWGWTIPEPQDRIDYIYYKGALIDVVDSHVYDGNGTILPKPYYQNNDWPSDHKAVYTDFIVH